MVRLRKKCSAIDFLGRKVLILLPPKGHDELVPKVIGADKFTKSICSNRFLLAMCNLLKVHGGVEKVWKPKHEHRGCYWILTKNNFLLEYRYYTNVGIYKNVEVRRKEK